MKNKLKNIFLTLIVALSLPLMMFLSACGATPSNEVMGVLFDSPTEEEGVAVFEVDLGVATDLPYKVFPSSASGYKVYYDPIDTGTDSNFFNFEFKDGNIVINSENFESIKYKIRVGDYSDTCIIKLKKYPNTISTTETNVVLNSNDVHNILIYGDYGKGNVLIDEDAHSFLVESSDETVVSVPNANRLKFIAVRENGTATAKVTVTMLDCSGEKTERVVEISVKVVQNIADCDVVMSACDEFVKNNDNVEINYNDSDLKYDATESEYKRLELNIYPINTNGMRCIDDNYLVNVTSSASYVKVSDDGKTILIKNTIPDDYSFVVKIFFPDLKAKDAETGEMKEFMIVLNLTIVK